MKYYICEGKPDGAYNASSKARKDVEIILDQLGYEKYFINTKNGVQKNKLFKPLQFLTYLINKNVWNKNLKKFKSGDTVIIQYPIVNTTLGIEKVIKKYAKKITIIALIHDMDSLRYSIENQGKLLYNRVQREDKYILNSCNYIIAHNYKMKEKLIEMGNDSEKIETLELFDYIIDENLKEIKHSKSNPIIIAGNLSKEKAKYLEHLKEIKNIKFNLYGKGYKKDKGEENINYKGAYLPEELLNHLEGSFGLVWDGISKDTCKGGFGEYLSYNNPHKASMYLTAGIPVIVWKEAAIAKFILDNNVGIAINNLDELTSILSEMTEEEYTEMLKNAKEISKELRNGNQLKKAISKISEK